MMLKFTEEDVLRAATGNQRGLPAISTFLFLHALLGDQSPPWLVQKVRSREQRQLRPMASVRKILAEEGLLKDGS